MGHGTGSLTVDRSVGGGGFRGSGSRWSGFWAVLGLGTPWNLRRARLSHVPESTQKSFDWTLWPAAPKEHTDGRKSAELQRSTPSPTPHRTSGAPVRFSGVQAEETWFGGKERPWFLHDVTFFGVHFQHQISVSVTYADARKVWEDEVWRRAKRNQTSTLFWMVISGVFNGIKTNSVLIE